MTDVYEQESTPVLYESGWGSDRSATDRAAKGGTFLSHLGDAMRENPASAALISMGVVWLFMGGSRVSLLGERERNRAYRDRRGSAYPLQHGPYAAGGMGSAWPAGSSGGPSTRRAASTISNAASAAGEQASEALPAMYDGLEEAAHRTSDVLSRAGSSAYEASQSMSQAASRATGALQESLSDLFERQPLAMGAVGLAIGAGLAAALPRTEVESRVMGETSDSVKEQAQGLISDQLQDAGKLADWALRAITQEAKAQGLSSSAIADVIRGFAEKVTSAASGGGEGENSSAMPGSRRS